MIVKLMKNWNKGRKYKKQWENMTRIKNKTTKTRVKNARRSLD